MKRRAAITLGLLLVALPLPAALPKILLVVHDLEEKPLPGLRFAYAGFESQKTTSAGATELVLPPGHREGQAIKVQLLPSTKKSGDWFLVNQQINVPSGAAPAELVLMRRSAFRNLANAARDAPGTMRSSKELNPEDKKKVLLETAGRYGLSAEQLETALRSFADTQDPKDRGIAAYLEGQYSRAEALLEGVVDKTENDLVETLQYLGSAQYEQAKFQAASISSQKALALRPDDPSLLNLLGKSLFALAQYAVSEPLLRRALAIDEKIHGPDHPHVARDLNSLAQLLQVTNRLDEAELLLRRALAIDEKIYGPDHPDVAEVLNNLAWLLQVTNRLEEAEPLLRRALAIYEKSYGPDHPWVAKGQNDLALLLQATNRLSEAEPLQRRALAIYEKSYGPDHPEVATNLSNLASLFRATNRLSEAEPLLRRALAIYEKSYGPDHPNVARVLNSLARLLQATNRLGEAEQLLRRALAIDEKIHGPDHPEVAALLSNLASLFRETNRLGEAEPLVRRALAIAEKSYGPDHPWVAGVLWQLAVLLQETNRLDEAEPLVRCALAIYEKSYSPDHPTVAEALSTLALLLLATNRLEEAEPLQRRALAILLEFGRRTGYEHRNLGVVRARYSALLEEMGKSPAEIEITIKNLTAPPNQ